MSVEVNNESGVDVDEARVVDLAHFVLGELEVDPLAELSLLLVDETTMTTLHEQWMDEPGPTDVLSFPMDELRPGGGASGTPGDDDEETSPALLGDVVVCPQVAARQAAAAGTGTADEVYLLCTHGILHLLGFDHAEPDEEREMFALQRDLLDRWRQQSGQAAP